MAETRLPGSVSFFDRHVFKPPRLCLAKMKNIKKQNLPRKICQTCEKPFAWRKKWEKDWDEVKFCSDKCRANKGKK